MSPRRALTIAVAVAALAAPTLIGCSTTTGTPTAAQDGTTTPRSSASAAPSAAQTTSVVPTPTGPPVGTATMKVIGDTAPVTIRYKINGGAEQTETNVTLPWEKEYPVYDEIESSVTAEGGDTELTCTIIMDGKLASFVTESNPTCSFSYWG